MSDSDNPLNATPNITKVCTVCGREFENAGGIVSYKIKVGRWIRWRI